MADETTVAVEAPAEKAQKPKKSSKLPLILAALVVVLLGGSGGAWFMMHRAKPAASVASDTTPKVTVHLDGFTVNLADTEDNHFLRVTMDLGLGHALAASGDKSDGNDFPTARTRDAILPVLTAGKADVLLTPEGKEQLKKDLIAALREKVPEIDVEDVYFTEFLVQR